MIEFVLTGIICVISGFGIGLIVAKLEKNPSRPYKKHKFIFRNCKKMTIKEESSSGFVLEDGIYGSFYNWSELINKIDSTDLKGLEIVKERQSFYEQTEKERNILLKSIDEAEKLNS
jgi:hypothetical protein